ncbi:sugar ABC transporter permease [Microbacterium sp. CFH 31415]|uniref:sugar ABC transporter permease n=1 Tax=Microbacterium sp. CFH 31415 TaxID=2921732 RepID=UPI001F148E83|nr:sugar ABC transporter permease [Microbacterium sp. CFH 31415]MCH6231010.1 sugar ABC transporter permease [Microbacterium sp. CFH 31415]
MSENENGSAAGPRQRSFGARTTLAVFSEGALEAGEIYGQALNAEHRPPTPHVRRQSFRRWFAEKGWRHVVAWAAIVFALFPLLYILSVSLNPIGTLTGSNQLFRQIDFSNYVRLFTDPDLPYPQWYANSLIIAVVTSVFTVLLCALGAYAFSRMRFTGRRFGLATLLVLQMFPQLLAITAIFLLMIQISDVFPAIGLGTHAGLIMIYLGGALGVNTFLMYGFFNTVPTAIDEAAKIDGAGHARVFFTIMLPLVTPILVVIGLLTFIGIIGEFAIASVILNDPSQQTVAIGLFQLVSGFMSQNWGVFAAGAVLAALPVMAFFLVSQRYIAGGLVSGSVK